ncbi:MAG TPA: DUF5706 domain-containing protein [Bellilinea sp.]|nr:DUF5706 domain-containing protein [Bellilinea sp.]
MDAEDKTTHLWSILEHNSLWIQAADNKAAAVLAIGSVLAAFLFDGAFDLARNPPPSPLPTTLGWLAVSLLVSGTALLLYSVVSALLCLLGRVGLKAIFSRRLEGNITRPSKTLIFFGSISQVEQEQYVQAIRDSDLASLVTDLGGQVHVLARIANKKYMWLYRAYTSLALSIFCFLVLGALIVF